MTPETTAAACKEAINDLGGAFAECPGTLRRARDMKITGWAFFVAGRGGALGDVRPDIVAAALGFIAPEAVAEGWEAARRVLPPDQVAAASLAECRRWGDEHLVHFAGLRRLTELAERAVLAADTTGMPLFAAWRAMTGPDGTVAAKAAVLLHLLREHRCSAHLLAVRASGLSPLEAILAGPDGQAGAVAFGWHPPYPQVGPLVRRRTWAEAVTDRLAGQAFRVLDPMERVELADLLEAALAEHRPARPTRPSLTSG